MTGPRSIVLGVDGGNTKTVAMVVDSQGTILGESRGGATDIHNGSPEEAMTEIARIVGGALHEAQISAQQIDSAAFSLAGADWPEDFLLLRSELPQRIGLVAPPMVVNDALGALRSGSPTWTGVAIACGTYNAIGARNSDGRQFHFGFWPDQAGGADLGQSALKAVYREGLGLGPATALSKRILVIYGAQDWRELVHGFTRIDSPFSRRDIHRLAFEVLEAAEAGDPVASALVDRSANVLAEQARASGRKVGLSIEGLPLVLTGSILQHRSRVLRSRLEACLPGAIALQPSVPPVVGAVLLAFDRAGIKAPDGWPFSMAQ
jgi:N-acetylglucosamine kinase-like BadF-type ATPase